ncbi:hypothetical protein [Aeromonas sp. MrichA-1]|uniref:hypothetical protein n=1 Tax=Aeromonas sp. MrichA-1 TaxID=2823362 RepID=UPI001B333F98|nr:hypothetical protein [Aeromonas sp. MrichA-1]MBP4081760.1 hypothetical protein [Aeromonas sp. MrichA-1]
MSLKDFLTDAVEGTLIIAGGMAALPILGPVGAVSTAGVIIAAVAGTAVAAVEHSSDDD